MNGAPLLKRILQLRKAMNDVEHCSMVQMEHLKDVIQRKDRVNRHLKANLESCMDEIKILKAKLLKAQCDLHDQITNTKIRRFEEADNEEVEHEQEADSDAQGTNIEETDGDEQAEMKEVEQKECEIAANSSPIF